MECAVEITRTYKYIRTKYISPEIINDMKYMYREGVSYSKIAKKYNLSYPTVKKYIVSSII